MWHNQVQVAVVLTLKATGGSEELQRERPVSAFIAALLYTGNSDSAVISILYHSVIVFHRADVRHIFTRYKHKLSVHAMVLLTLRQLWSLLLQATDMCIIDAAEVCRIKQLQYTYSAELCMNAASAWLDHLLRVNASSMWVV
jgi:hypothetical protein